jgi:hypothetical protein
VGGGEDALIQKGDANFDEADGWIPNHGESVVEYRIVSGPGSCQRKAIFAKLHVASQVADPSVCTSRALGVSS